MQRATSCCAAPETRECCDPAFVRDRWVSEQPTCGCEKRSLVRLACFRPVLYRERRNSHVSSHPLAGRRSHDSWHLAPVFSLLFTEERPSGVRRHWCQDALSARGAP